MNEDLQRLAEQLEQECAAFTDEAVAGVQHRAHTRARRRKVAYGSIAAAFLLLVAGVLAASRDGDTTTEDISVVDQPDTTTTISPQPTTSAAQPSVTDTAPVTSSSDRTVDTDFSEGWTAVHVGLPDVESGWVPEALWAAPEVSAGDVIETYAPDGHLIGYYIRASGFVPLDDFDAPDFDWQTYIRGANIDDPEFADRVIADIQEDGGLGPIQTAEMAGVG